MPAGCGELLVRGRWMCSGASKACERAKRSISRPRCLCFILSVGCAVSYSAWALLGNVKVSLDARAFRGAICLCVRQEEPSSACCLSHLASLPLSTDADGYFPYLVFVPRLIDCNFASPFYIAHFKAWSTEKRVVWYGSGLATPGLSLPSPLEFIFLLKRFRRGSENEEKPIEGRYYVASGCAPGNLLVKTRNFATSP